MINLIFLIRQYKKSIKSFSEKTGITLERLNQIANEEIQPSMSDVRKVARVTKKTIDFLISENNQYNDLNLLFRENAKSESDELIADKFSHIVGNSLAILSNSKQQYHLKARFTNVPQTYEGAESLAFEFRNKYLNGDTVSPLLNLPKILTETLDFVIYITDLGRNRDGASAVFDTVPFIFLSPSFEPRMLFTMAHELGHILAHHDLNQNFFKLDHKISAIERDSKSIESFANAFASCLLLPPEGVLISIRKIKELHRISNNEFGDIEIILLSRIYGVSFEVAAQRCEQLELLPKGGAKSLYAKISEQYNSPEQRADSLNLPPRPKIDFSSVSSKLTRAAIEKINSGELSLGKASEILSISISDLYKKHLEF